MLLCICARIWIDLLQIINCKRSFFWILSFILLIKVNKFWITLAKLCDNKTHLIAPVPQMHIPNHLVSFKTKNPF